MNVEEGGCILFTGTVCGMMGEKTKISEDSQFGDVTSDFYCSVNEVLTLHFSGMLCHINW